MAATQQGQVPKPNGAATLYLVAGDRIPCEAPEINEEGVHFKSTVVDTTFVPHSAVKAVELGSNWAAGKFVHVKQVPAKSCSLPQASVKCEHTPRGVVLAM
jgi:hypothetical protein